LKEIKSSGRNAEKCLPTISLIEFGLKMIDYNKLSELSAKIFRS